MTVARGQLKHSRSGFEALIPVHPKKPSESAPSAGNEVVSGRGYPSLDTIDHNCRDLSQDHQKAVRLFNRQATKEKLFLLYQSAGLTSEADRLKNCCSKFGTLVCPDSHIASFYPTERCRLPLCPDCGSYRAKRAFKRLFPKFQSFAQQHKKDRLILITLTLKNTSDNLLKIHQFFKKSFRKLRQTVGWKSKIRGGVASFEVTVDKQGNWHYHCHILAFRSSAERYEQADLSNDWRRATAGKGFIVDIRQVRDLSAGFREVLKYSFKPLDLAKNRFDADKLQQFYALCLRGRLAESFGAFYGLEMPETDENEGIAERLEVGSPCPKCKKPLDFVFHTRNELESLFFGHDLTFFPLKC